MLVTFSKKALAYYKLNGLRSSLGTVKRSLLRLPDLLQKTEYDPESILSNVTGVIHIGANDGGERFDYAAYGLKVIWIEPIPEVFTQLQLNIQGYDGHIALNCLVTDKIGEEYDFNVANNNGASSSIFDFKEHKERFPTVNYRKSIKLKSTTLKEIVRTNKIDLDQYQLLAMDTQGSELLILKGAGEFLKKFRYITTEAADFEPYAGGCFEHEISDYVRGFGFEEVKRTEFARVEGSGAYYNITYERVT